MIKNDRESKLRVFISYSRENRDKVEELVSVLESFNFRPMWDKNFAGGTGFHGQIKNFIAHSHVFMPILTDESSGWVHQEIGYAIALNIPVLPICIGTIPSQMINELHALNWNEDLLKMGDGSKLKHTIEQLVRKSKKNDCALYECADYHQDRTQMMVDYSDKVHALNFKGCVRQFGALSSFHIPDKPHNHPIWETRKEPRDPKSKVFPNHHLAKLLYQERLTLEQHARERGCKLIVNPITSIATRPESAACRGW